MLRTGLQFNRTKFEQSKFEIEQELYWKVELACEQDNMKRTPKSRAEYIKAIDRFQAKVEMHRVMEGN